MEKINFVCLWIGYIVAGFGSLFATCFIAFVLFKWSMDCLGRIFPNLRIMIEYVYYRKDYLEWVKDKERLPMKKKK